MTIQFDIASGDAQVDLGGTFLNGFIGFGGSTIKLVLDGTGNMQTFVDGSSIGTTGGQQSAVTSILSENMSNKKDSVIY